MTRRFAFFSAVVLVPAWASVFGWPDPIDVGYRSGRPRLVVTASRLVGLAPLRVAFSADVVSGMDEDERFSCPTIRWDWNDDTTSESTSDCPPYRAGTRGIVRHFSIEHSFVDPGDYRVSAALFRNRVALASDGIELLVK
jgi:hypothetical protein